MPTTPTDACARLLWLLVAPLALAIGAAAKAGELPGAQEFNFANVDGIREHGVAVSTAEYRGRKALRVVQPARGDGQRTGAQGDVAQPQPEEQARDQVEHEPEAGGVGGELPDQPGACYHAANTPRRDGRLPQPV